MRRTILALTGGVVAAALGAAAVFLVLDEPDSCGSAVAGGAEDIGGFLPPVLHTGEERDGDAPLGRPFLVYFGYTYCPDVCPLDVAYLSDATYELDALGLSVTPVFVTIDPERDSAKVLADFIAPFHPRMLGLSGVPEDIAESASAWRVYYARGEGEDDYYLMDHSAITYLADADNRYVAHFTHGTPPAAIAERVACHARAGRI